MPHTLARRVEPIVLHGLKELSQGAPIEHVLREVALMGAMVGAGLAPMQAIAKFERQEPSLGQMPPSEAAETGYQPGFAPPMYQKPYGKMAPGGWGAPIPMPPVPWGGPAPNPWAPQRPY